MTPTTSSYKSISGLRHVGKALGYSLQGFQADAISLERHPLLGRAKDLGSAAVMLLLLLTALVWLAVAFDRYVH